MKETPSNRSTGDVKRPTTFRGRIARLSPEALVLGGALAVGAVAAPAVRDSWRADAARDADYRALSRMAEEREKEARDIVASLTDAELSQAARQAKRALRSPRPRMSEGLSEIDFANIQIDLALTQIFKDRGSINPDVIKRLEETSLHRLLSRQQLDKIYESMTADSDNR